MVGGKGRESLEGGVRIIKPSINGVELPSPREIETLCAVFRSEWTHEQEASRRFSRDGGGSQWSVPQFMVHHSESPRCGKGRTIVYLRID